MWFDATYEKVRQGGRIVSQAAVVAVGVRASGEKSVLGLAVGASETTLTPLRPTGAPVVFEMGPQRRD